jgi:hypothetical protein
MQHDSVHPGLLLVVPSAAAVVLLLPEFVTMVVTEFGMIPPSSVPVILREFSQSAQLE